MKELKLLSLVLVAGTATMFTACTSESDNSPSANISYESVAAAQQVPVTFGTYLGETPITRAGTTGAMDNTLLQSTGFGVFAYYSDNGVYTTNTSTPNFMHNQAVTHSSSWTYTPIKYWPNETFNGTVDRNGASATNADVISFFAYAPFVNSFTTGTGPVVTWNLDHATGLYKDGSSNNYYVQPGVTGITKITDNSTAQDPKVWYSTSLSSDPADIVDLLWGVVPTGTSYDIAQSSTKQAPTAGLPNLNLTKQTIGETVDFAFLHALSKLTFTVQGYFDEISVDGSGDHVDPSNNVDTNTRIVVKQVDITNSTFKSKAILNLNNETARVPKWEADGATTEGDRSIVYGQMNSAIAYSGTDGTHSGITGVNKNKQDLFATGRYFALIPNASGSFDITITYDVFTADNQLSGGYSKVENVIKKSVSGLNFVGNKHYTINLQLGMTTVKVTATVEGWDTPAVEAEQVDLPINVN